jgi:hypothetical protein
VTLVNGSFPYNKVGQFRADAYDEMDWLEYQGSSLKRDPTKQDPISGMRFGAMLPENLSPNATDFPADGTYNGPCHGVLNLTITFTTPEEYTFNHNNVHREKTMTPAASTRASRVACRRKMPCTTTNMSWVVQ